MQNSRKSSVIFTFTSQGLSSYPVREEEMADLTRDYAISMENYKYLLGEQL